MTVAITVPTFNRSGFLAEAIASIQSQTFSDWRLVVVDDGSTDETAELVRSLAKGDPRIRLVTQERRGGAAARNKGIAEIGDAQYAAFLDDDDVWESDALETLIATLEATPTAVAAHGLARMVDEQGRRIRPGLIEAQGLRRMSVNGFRLSELPVSAPTTFSVLAVSNVITTPGQVIVRKAALAKAAPFKEPAADWQMWLGLSKQGPFAFVPRVVVGWRWHGGNISSHEFRTSASRLRVHWSLLWSAALSRAQRRIACVGFLRYYMAPQRVIRKAIRLSTRIARGRELQRASD
jgi:glycosyltransferase involved in cell wall biosynthesis